MLRFCEFLNMFSFAFCCYPLRFVASVTGAPLVPECRFASFPFVSVTFWCFSLLSDALRWFRCFMLFSVAFRCFPYFPGAFKPFVCYLPDLMAVA